MRWIGDDNVALFTDLYELTMAASYHAHGVDHEATFDLFVRKLPEHRNFLVAAGIGDALSYLESLRFDAKAVDYLRSLDLFDHAFLDHLAELRFTGDVWAVPEGEVVFANEPLLRVTGPLIPAQLAETFLINAVGTPTMIASKAARIAIACAGRRFVDFSARRDHGADSALKGARASFIAGASGTSLVAAGQAYGLPLSGTMAHAYVMTFDDETEAFRSFARDFPNRAVLLIDTYDTERGARRVVEAARALDAEGIQLRGVRLDSGDLCRLAFAVRRILDEGGLDDVMIFASGDLDEYRITEIVAAGAPVDAFGVGTQLGTSGDAPYLGGVYKLVDDVHGPKIKLSEGKVTLPGRKQVWRVGDGTEEAHDVISLEDEVVEGGRPLLRKVMEGGRRLEPDPPLEEAQRYCRESLSRLPSRLRTLHQRERPYEVRVAPGLDALVEQLSSGHRVHQVSQ